MLTWSDLKNVKKRFFGEKEFCFVFYFEGKLSISTDKSDAYMYCETNQVKYFFFPFLKGMEITKSRVIIFLLTIIVLEIGHLSKFPSPALLVRPVPCTEQVWTKIWKLCPIA